MLLDGEEEAEWAGVREGEVEGEEDLQGVDGHEEVLIADHHWNWPIFPLFRLTLSISCRL